MMLIINTRKQVPWAVLYAALGIMLAASYFVSGLFTLQDVTVFNYGQKLLYIFFHPLHIWWNEKTLIVMGTACILWLMGVSYFLTYYRNYHFGKEHGTADWGEIHSMQKKLADPDPMRNTIISRNISIGFDAISNMNLLIIGGFGSGKTTGIVIPNILLGSCTNVMQYLYRTWFSKHQR